MALSANTQREVFYARKPEVLIVPVNAGSHIFAGGIVMREAATSVFVPGADTAGCVFAGIALEELDNTGADGVVDGLTAVRAIRIERGGCYEFTLDGATPKPFDVAYVVDDTTVSGALTTNAVKCGVFLRLGPNGGWIVDTSFATAAAAVGAAAGAPADFIADASVAHALNSTFSDTEVEGALDDIGGTVNAILAVLIAKGLMAAS